jgi:hypothetical protein
MDRNNLEFRAYSDPLWKWSGKFRSGNPYTRTAQNAPVRAPPKVRKTTSPDVPT